MAETSSLLRSPEIHKLHGLDHLRALAILLVFLFHYKNPIFGHPLWLEDAAKFGWTGVDLFFVLSGFLISSRLFATVKAGHRISLSDFFTRRFFRILPAFWVVLAIYVFCPAFHEREQLPPVWRYLAFTQNFGLNIRDFGTFSHAWSLCVEEHFYVLLPFLLVGLCATRLFKLAYWIPILLFAGGLLLRHYIWTNHYQPVMNEEGSGVYWFQYIYYPTYNRLDGLLTGVSIAAFYHFRAAAWSRVSKYGNYLIAMSIVVLACAYMVCDNAQSYTASVWGYPLVALGYGILLMGAVSPASFLYKWKSRTTTFIATLSYAIYLTHKGVLHVTQGMGTGMGLEMDSNLMLSLCILCCLAGALLLHIAVERPFMKLRRKLLEMNSTPSAAPIAVES